MICLFGTHSNRSLFWISVFASLFVFDALLANKNSDTVATSLDLQQRIGSIFNNHSSSVVRVKATREVNLDSNKTRRLLKMGSGFFVSKDGHILTTGLLNNPDRIWIEYDESYYLAENIGRDPLCNLSLLKISNKPANFTFVSLGDPIQKNKVGSSLIALTCALEFQVGPTNGLFQSYEYSFGKKIFPTRMLRCSLGLGPGEVGAPVFDLSGRFVGICHAALPDLRSSFVLPALACQRIRDDLIFSGKVEYGWFGISTTRKLNESNGFDIVVQNLVEKSPASKSKLSVGDVILKIDDKTVIRQGDLANAAFFSRPDTIVEFLVSRDGKEILVPVKTEARPENSNKDVLFSSNSPSMDSNSTGNLK